MAQYTASTFYTTIVMNSHHYVQVGYVAVLLQCRMKWLQIVLLLSNMAVHHVTEHKYLLCLSCYSYTSLTRCTLNISFTNRCNTHTQEDGKFVVMRDPNKAVVRIYSVPMSTFEEDSDEEQDNADDNEDED
jgi:hypothetical protein